MKTILRHKIMETIITGIRIREKTAGIKTIINVPKRKLLLKDMIYTSSRIARLVKS